MASIFVNARFLCERATGVGRLAIEVAKQLKVNNPSIRFVAHGDIYYSELADQLEVEVFGRLKRMPWEQIELPLFLSKQKDPILINLANSAPILFSRNIVVIPDILWKRNPEWYTKKSILYFRFLIPIILKKALHVLTISEFSRSEIIEAFEVPNDKIDIIPCAVSDDFTQLKGNQGRLKVETPYIISVSSIDPRKNLRRLIEAYKKLGYRGRGIKLVLVGQEYKAFPKINFGLTEEERESIIFTGYVTDEELVFLYQNALLFVYPSLGEGFGLPPLEAMSKGCPVVVSNTTSLPDVCGDAAIYINPTSVDSIMHGVDQLASSKELRQELSFKGFRRYKEFSWSVAARKITEIVKNFN